MDQDVSEKLDRLEAEVAAFRDQAANEKLMRVITPRVSLPLSRPSVEVANLDETTEQVAGRLSPRKYLAVPR